MAYHPTSSPVCTQSQTASISSILTLSAFFYPLSSSLSDTTDCSAVVFIVLR